MTELQAAYLGPNWQNFSKLADIELVVDGVSLPAHLSTLALQSEVVLELVERQSKKGSKVQLSEPFAETSKEGVLLFLKCCYKPDEVKSFMEASLREKPSEVPLHELLALFHRFQASGLLQVCEDHLTDSLMPQLRREGLAKWVATADACGCTRLQALAMEEVRRQDAAATAPTYLATSAERQSDIVSATTIPALVHLLDTSEIGTQVNAARALLDLACSSSEHLIDIVAMGAVPHLVELLETLERQQQASTLWVLTNSSTPGPEQLPISLPNLPPGTLSILASLLESCKEIREVAKLSRVSLGEQAQNVERVAELTATSSLCREEVAGMGMVPMLLDVLRGCDSNEVMLSAAKALANLCLEAMPASSVVAAKGIPLFLKRMQGGGAEEDARALLNLAYSSPEHLYAIVSSGGIPSLVLLLANNDKELQGRATRLAAYLCQRGPDYQSAVVSAGAVPLLVRLLGSKDEDLQATAARAIGHLCHQSFDFRSVIAASGAIPALVRLLYSSDKDVQKSAVWTLANMADLSHIQQFKIVLAGAIPPLVRLLESKDNDVQGTAARAITSLSDWSHGHRSAIVSAGATPPLVRLLDSPDANIQKEAAQALAYLGTPEAQPGVASIGRIACLEGLLDSASKQVQGEAVEALEDLSGRGWEARCAAASPEAIPGLKWLLSSTNLYQQARAAHVVSYLHPWTSTCESAIISADAIPDLVRLLGSVRKEVQAYAARGIANLSAMRDHSIVSVIESAGAIPGLVEPLACRDPHVQGEAEKAIAQLANAVAWHHGISTSATCVIPPLVRLLDNTYKTTQSQTVAAIMHQADIKPASAIPLLVQLLESKDNDVLEYAVRAIAILAAGTAGHRAAIVSADGIPPLVRLLQNKDHDVREYAVRTIALLAAGTAEHGTAIVSAGGISPLVQLLDSKDTDVQLCVAGAISNLAAMTAEHRAPIVFKTAIPSLVRLLENKDKDVQLCAARAMVDLAARSAEHRTAIVSAGAMPSLVRLRGSKDKDVQECAARAITDLAAEAAEQRVPIASADASSRFMFGYNVAMVLGGSIFLGPFIFPIALATVVIGYFRGRHKGEPGN